MNPPRRTAGKKTAGERPLGLGEIAIFNRLLTREQVDECLAIQKEMAEKGFSMSLGKILIEKFYLDRVTVNALLRAQAAHRGPQPGNPDTSIDIVKFTPAEHDTLVRRVREKQLIRAEQVDECFDIQVALDGFGIDKLLGEIAIEKGYLDRSVVADILAHHESVRTRLVQRVVSEDEAAEEGEGEGPGEDSELLEALKGRVEPEAFRQSRRFRFGRLAVEKGLVTQDALAEALYAQFRLKELGIIKRIGEILVLKGGLREPDVRRILQLQKQRMGKIRWGDMIRTESLAREDLRLGLILVENGILSQDEVDECRFVQKAMKGLGLEFPLAQVIWEKGCLDRELVEAIQKEEARRVEAEADVEAAQAGPVQVGTMMKSKALEKAYEEILSRMKEEPSGEIAAEPSSGVVLRRASGISPRPVQAAPAGRRRKELLVASVVALVVLAVPAVAFLVTRSGGDEGPPAETGEVRTGPAAPETSGGAGGGTWPGGGRGPGEVPGPGGGPDGTGRPSAGDDETAELRKALAAIVLPEDLLARLDAAPGAAAVLVARAHLSAGSSPRLRLLVAGETLYPEKTDLFVSLHGFGRTLGQERAEIRRAGSAASSVRFEASFGPFASEPPRSLEGDALPWFPAGKYTVRVAVRTGTEPAWREEVEAKGLPFEGEITAEEYFHPSREGLEAARLEGEEEIRGYIGALLSRVGPCREALESIEEECRGGKIAPEAATGRLEQAIAAVVASRDEVDRFKELLVEVPLPTLFAQVVDYHESLLAWARALAASVSEPEKIAARTAPAAERARELAGSIRFQLGEK